MTRFDPTLSEILGFARRLLPGLAACALLAGCASSGPPPLRARPEPIELERFMGDWFVQGSIPIDTWFASEAGAHNAVESYALRGDGKIATTYSFRRDAFDGEPVRFTPVGWVHDDETNTEWRMQFVWPFRSAYLIVHVDDAYSETIVGVPSREHVWLMTRAPEIGDERYRALVERAAGLGYETGRIRRVPQRWSD